ncbi:MAG: HNH endonuclease [Gammaproteobacteria bacterium]|nr:HNH endonuclease [Gammaproteobacteria bacterium]NIR82875.1 HNH endonuclease [Gammaproteobacteria bacterium]NIR89984.1 HNH endonuclease [Gammaproteobacteria bacterium]NIU04033.1 HNH endonuclease [Gammaproteobacteria bacterium]NIV51353.1 HNH endonuclease [Gammaproteobacteria bacterium]
MENIRNEIRHEPLSLENVHASALILKLDITGQPVRWIPWQDAVVLHAREMIAWNAGITDFTFRGGLSRLTGTRSTVTVNSIIAVKGRFQHAGRRNLVPPLSNRSLFHRDGHMCMYCGRQLSEHLLTRDHLLPLSRGGTNWWKNVVTACKSCNHAKGARTPDEAGMALLAIPYVPNRAEYLVLMNRRILVDQMEFLKKRFGRASRLHALH